GSSQRIARAGLYQRLEHALVGKPEVENLAQRVQRSNPPAQLLARRDDRGDGALTEALDCRQPESHALAVLDREIQLALVDVGRQHRDAALARLGQVDRQLVGVLRLDGEERRGEMPWV